MSYLWENYDLENTYELAEKNFLPYTEIFQMKKKTAKVNIMYRFAAIHENLADYLENEASQSETRKDTMNILFHLLANIDFYSGITKKDFRMMKIYDEIKAGKYEINTELFEQMELRHLYKILSYMDIKKEQRNRNCLFFDCISEIFDASFYYSKAEDTYIIQLYCDYGKKYGTGGGYSAKQLYDLIKELMCDYWLSVEEYWKIPIGILGDSMYIDNIQLI